MYSYKKLTRKLDKKIKKMIRENIQNENWDFYSIKKRKHKSLSNLLLWNFIFIHTKQWQKFWMEIANKNHKKKIILGRDI